MTVGQARGSVHALLLATSMTQFQMHGRAVTQEITQEAEHGRSPVVLGDAHNGGVTHAHVENCTYPKNCPHRVLPRADKQTWMMNRSTIIMPCNDTGFTDPRSTRGWAVVDFE